jgi:hypothetical protein
MSKNFEERKELLNLLNVKYTFEQEWRSKDHPSGPHPLNIFKTVNLFGPLTPEDWCCLCMREGAAYIGGCCGNTSAIQDIINGWFRFDACYVKITEIAEVAQAMEEHDDDKGWSELSKTTLKESVEWAKDNWCTLNPWEKIKIIWHVVKDHYSPDVPTGYGNNLSELDKAVNVVGNTCQMIAWDRIVGDDFTGGQKDSNKVAMLARMLPALKMLWNSIEDIAPEPFEGFALYDLEANSICVNRMGLCVYATMNEVQRIIGLWTEQEGEYELGHDNRKSINERVKVRPVRITIKDGIKFLDKLEINGEKEH